jgi:D-xylose transport system permease protein
MGILTGVLVSAVGIPSFVVTLATFLAYQGVLLWIIGTGGTLPINDEVILGISNGNMPVTLGWIVVIASITAYAGINLIVYQRRRAANLVTPPPQVIVLRIAAIAVLLLGATFLLSQNRSKGAIVLEGIPWIAPIVGVLLVLWTFVQNRTAFGRHVYAVGGNAEAARRAGIRIGRITIACFVISSAMAVTAGIIAASRLNSITPDAGAGNTLLYAVAAAVIGGTSLFGGKRKARDAIIGGLVIAVVDNGLGLGLQAYIKCIVTGLVLLLAASVDALSRPQPRQRRTLTVPAPHAAVMRKWDRPRPRDSCIPIRRPPHQSVTRGNRNDSSRSRATGECIAQRPKHAGCVTTRRFVCMVGAPRGCAPTMRHVPPTGAWGR